MTDPINHAGEDLFRRKEMQSLSDEMAAVARLLCDRGWAERNAGNFSVNVTPMVEGNCAWLVDAGTPLPLGRIYPGLAEQVFLVSGTGTRMRDLAGDPTRFTCFVAVGAKGDMCRIFPGNTEAIGVKPTSELATHLALQQMLRQSEVKETVVLHAHVTDLIALTHLPQFRSAEAINSALMQIHPELGMFLPGGAGFIPFTVPGTESIADATLQGFAGHATVIWEKHGGMAVGTSLNDAFDRLDLLAKAAAIWFRCRSAGLEIR